MRKMRLNLSGYKGMNLTTFAHASKEANLMFNLKNTENGLQMRTGAKTCSDADDAISGVLLGESNDILVGDGQLVRWSNGYELYSNHVSPYNYPVYPTNFHNILLDKAANPLDTEEKVYDDSAAVKTQVPNIFVLFYNSTENISQAMSLFSYNPELKTILDATLCQREDYSAENKMVSQYVLVEPQGVSLSTTEDNLQQLCVFGRKQDVYNIGDFSNPNDNYYKLKGTKGAKVWNEASSGDRIADCVLIDSHFFYIDIVGDYLRHGTTGGGTYIATGTNATRLQVARTSDTEYMCFVLDDDGIEVFTYDTVVGTFTAHVPWTYTATTFIDIALFFVNSATSGATTIYPAVLFGITNTGLVKALDFVGGVASWQNITLSGLPTSTDFTRISVSPIVTQNSQDTYMSFLPIITLYGDTHINIYSFNITLSPITIISNITQIDSLSSKSFPLVDGDILSIAVGAMPANVLCNYQTQVAIRPSFAIMDTATDLPDYLISTWPAIAGSGTISTSDNIVTFSTPQTNLEAGDILEINGIADAATVQIIEMTNSTTAVLADIPPEDVSTVSWNYFKNRQDIYGIPILENYEIPIDPDSARKFTGLVSYCDRTAGTLYYAWKYWLFTVFPGIQLDTSFTNMKLWSGSYDDNGWYEVTSWAEEETSITASGTVTAVNGGTDGLTVTVDTDADILTEASVGDYIRIYGAKRKITAILAKTGAAITVDKAFSDKVEDYVDTSPAAFEIIKADDFVETLFPTTLESSSIVLMDMGDTYFRGSPIWKLFSEEYIQIQDFSVGTNFSVILDNRTKSIYCTIGGLAYHDKGLAYSFPDDVIVSSINADGVFIMTESGMYLCSGQTPESLSVTQICYDAFNKDTDYFGLSAIGSVAAFYNKVSVFVYTGGILTDVGRTIEPYLFSDNSTLHYVAFDTIANSLWVPIKSDSFTWNGVSFSRAFAIYENGTWRIYGYVDDDFEDYTDIACWFSPRNEGIVGNFSTTVKLLEVRPEYFRDTMTYQNEDWDALYSVFRTREMSFDTPGQMKNIRWLELDSHTLRDNEDRIYPDYFRLRVYQGYNPIGTNQDVLLEIEDTAFNENSGLSMKFPLKCNMYSGTLEFIFGMDTIDEGVIENPCMVLVDVLLDVLDIHRSRRGVYN